MKHQNDPAFSGHRTGRHVASATPIAAGRPAAPRHVTASRPPRGLTDKVSWVAIGDLKPFPGNPRHHPEDQIARLMRSIDRVWTSPILIDETRTILAGH